MVYRTDLERETDRAIEFLLTKVAAQLRKITGIGDRLQKLHVPDRQDVLRKQAGSLEEAADEITKIIKWLQETSAYQDETRRLIAERGAEIQKLTDLYDEYGEIISSCRAAMPAFKAWALPTYNAGTFMLAEKGSASPRSFQMPEQAPDAPSQLDVTIARHHQGGR